MGLLIVQHGWKFWNDLLHSCSVPRCSLLFLLLVWLGPCAAGICGQGMWSSLMLYFVSSGHWRWPSCFRSTATGISRYVAARTVNWCEAAISVSTCFGRMWYSVRVSSQVSLSGEAMFAFSNPSSLLLSDQSGLVMRQSSRRT